MNREPAAVDAAASVPLSDRERYVTEQVQLWLENDHPVTTRAHEVLAQDGPEALGRYLAAFIRRAPRGQAAWHLRQELAVNDYDRVDWAAVGASLTS